MAKFCTKCGRRLEEGEVCSCSQNVFEQPAQPGETQVLQQNVQAEEPVYQQQNVQAEQTGYQQNAQSGQMGYQQNMQSGQMGLPQNILAQALSVLKNPITETRSIASKDSKIFGLGMIGVKAAVILIFTLITMFRMYFHIWRYIGLPRVLLGTIAMVVFALVMTAGKDCLEAILLKVMTGAFKGEITDNATFTIVGSRALFEAILIFATGIINIVSMKFALLIFVLGMTVYQCVQFGSYMAATQLDENKKVYVYCIVKACVTIAVCLVAYIYMKVILANVLGYMGNVFNPYYFMNMFR